MKPNSTSKLVPLNNAQSDVVDVNLVLPAAVGLEQLGIDIIQLETLCKIAGIRKLTIGNKKNEAEGVTIAGRNSDGTALGGIASAKAESSSSQKRTIIPLKASMYMETDIEIDIAMLARTISENFPEGVRSLDGWSQELEEIITKHLGNEGLKFLLSAEKYAMGVDIAMLLMGYITMTTLPPALATAIIARLGGYVASYRAGAKRYPEEPNMRISPLSIAGVEWDRALVLMIMIASTRNLIGKMSQD